MEEETKVIISFGKALKDGRIEEILPCLRVQVLISIV
jgi:hypothetical protein